MTTLIKRLIRTGICGTVSAREPLRLAPRKAATASQPRSSAFTTDWNSQILSYDDFR